MDALYHLGLYQLGWDGRPEAELALVDGFARRLARQERRSRKDAQKALQFFSLAAQNGHVRALHKVGRLYARALGVRRSCDVAANAYKTVAERGPWVAQLAEAHAVYARGDVDGARRAYARLAEAGYEVAQANAAWLLDRAARAARRGAADCLGTSAGDCEGRARRLHGRTRTDEQRDRDFGRGRAHDSGWPGRIRHRSHEADDLLEAGQPPLLRMHAQARHRRA